VPATAGAWVTVAAGADITFISSAREGDVLVATAAERTSYSRSGIYDVTVRRGDVIAEFRGRSGRSADMAWPGQRIWSGK